MTPHLVSLVRFWAILALPLALVGCSKDAQQARSAARAQQSFDSGEYEKAKIEYLALLQKNRTNGDYIFRLGQIWMRQGALLQAVPFLRRANELGKVPTGEKMLLVQALAGAGMREEARKEAKALLAADAAHGEALIFLADSARTRTEFEEVQQGLSQFPFKESAASHLTLSILLDRTGQRIQSDAAVERALAADPKSVQALLASSRARFRRQDVEGAKAAAKAAAELASLRSMDRLQYPELLFRVGEVEAARQDIDPVVKSAPDFIPALVFSAHLHQAAKAYDEALGVLDRVFALDSANLSARLLQADVLVAKQDAKQAVEVLEKLDTMYGGAAFVRIKLAQAMMADGNLARAAELLNKVLVNAVPEVEIEASLVLAEVTQRANNPAGVVALMTGLLEKHDMGKFPRLEAGIDYLAQAYENQRRFDEGLRLVRAILEKRPGDVDYLGRLARLLGKSGQSAEARKVYEELLKNNPRNESAWSELVALELQDGKSDEALARAQARRQAEPDSPTAAFTEASVRIARGEWKEAEAPLRKVLELDPKHPEAPESLSRLYFTQDRVPEAVATMEARIAIVPGDIQALRQLAMLYSHQRDWAKAAGAYERLLALIPASDPFALNNLAALYADHLGRPEPAYELARKARSLRPSVTAAVSIEDKNVAASIADTLGWLTYRRGEFAEAYSLLQEAVRVLGDNPEVQAHFGLAAASMGKTEEAKAALTAAAEAPDDFPAKAEARQRLDLLAGNATADQSAAELASLADASPNDPLLQIRLAEAREKEKDLAGAAKAYEAALRINPQLVVAVRKLAEYYAGPLNDRAKAMAHARAARDLAPNDPHVAGVLGRLAFADRDFKFAYELLIEATRTGVDSTTAWLDLGWAAYSLGRTEEARKAVQKALDSKALDSTLAEKATRFMELTGRPGPGEAAAQQALAADPASVPAIMVLAEARQQAGETGPAVAFWRKAVEIYPDFFPARRELALALAADPSTRGEAYEIALKARESLPEDPDLTETLGILVHYRKDPEYAIELFTEVARLRPLKPHALFCLGAAQLAVGKVEEGRTTLNQAVAAGLAAPEAEEAARLLKSAKTPAAASAQ